MANVDKQIFRKRIIRLKWRNGEESRIEVVPSAGESVEVDTEEIFVISRSGQLGNSVNSVSR